MDSDLIRVADAVVAELNAAGLSQTVNAARQYRPEFELPVMQVLHMTVVPKAVETTLAARGRTQNDHTVDIGVQKKYAVDDSAEIDSLMGLVQEIATYFRFRRLAAVPEAAWVKTVHAPVYAPEHMAEYRQFTSVITLTFRMID
ncbi:MAG: hypothetical protein ACREJ2_03145 [Planctomycetota bacterium]